MQTNYVSSILIGTLHTIFVPISIVLFHDWYNVLEVDSHNRYNCSCWDTIFRDPLPEGSTTCGQPTIKMQLCMVQGIVVSYTLIEKFAEHLIGGRLRWSVGIIFLVSNSYVWWGTINYYSGSLCSSRWHHQHAFFTVSELVTTLLSVQYLDKSQDLPPLPLLVIANIAVFHIFLASWDQFVSNVILGQRKVGAVLRDLLFMSTDIIYISVIAVELCQNAKTTSRSLKDVILSANLKVLVSLNCMLIFFTLVLFS